MASRSRQMELKVPAAPHETPGQSPLHLLIAGGGTGGHLYPGIAIAREFRRRHPGSDVLFVGTARGLETRIVPAEGFPLELIEVSGLNRVGWRQQIRSLLLLPGTCRDVLRLLRRRKPDLVLGVGGYASGPVVLLAALLGIPTIVAEQNAIPGLTNRLLSRVVDVAVVSFEEALGYFGRRAVLTGNPVRAAFFELAPRPVASAADPLCVLVTGGSQGARAVNRVLVEALRRLREAGDRFHFIHQTGPRDHAWVSEAYREAGVTAEVVPFVERMDEAFARADLVICRAGATTVAELAAAGRPALMVPFPQAADDHQRKNAAAVARVGGGVMIVEAEWTPERLTRELLALADAPERLTRMAEAIRTLARPDAAGQVVDLMGQLIGERHSR
jgi:UDP-N-acetylglucosamine--N-acetylmuramyl-(pentapeptide) pyrophosphoryl-undecaprenol N-acetylglucosamine transferase